MKVTVLLADSGQSDSSGKSHMLGLGWTVVDAPTTQPMAVFVLVTFTEGADETGQHEIVLRLLADDGSPVVLPAMEGPVVLKAGVEFAMRPEGTVPHAPANAPFIVNIGPGLPLSPDSLYRWEAEVDGKSEQRGDVTFATRRSQVHTAAEESG